MRPNKTVYHGSVILFLLILSYAFCSPLLRDMSLSGRGDWDYFASLYEIPAISWFRYGQLPLWNPYCGGGLPLIGNPQAGLFSPTFILTSIFGVFAGLKVSVWLHTFLGLWGMWLLIGHLGGRGPARLLSAAIFMFSSPWALHLAEGHIVWLPAAFLPFFFLAFLKGLGSRRWMVLASVFESLMFYEGGTYVFAFSLLFVGFYSACNAVETRSPRPILSFVVVNVLAAALAAPKLFPVLELLGGHPRALDAGGAVSWDDYLAMLIERPHSLSGFETGAYLGFVGLVLYLFSLSLIRKNKALVLTSLFLIALSVGGFAKFSPWVVLHGLPLVRNFQVPARSMIVVFFSVALLIGLYLGKGGAAADRRLALLVGLVVAYVTADLFLTDSPLLAEASKPVDVSPLAALAHKSVPKRGAPLLYHAAGTTVADLWAAPPPKGEPPFSQIRVPDFGRFAHGAWSDQFLPLLQNRGVVDAYETLPFTPHARAVSDADYRGEFYLLGAGGVALRTWSPNRFVLHVRLMAPERLVINQNYWPGWRVSRGALTRHEGLLAVDLPAGEYDVALRYLPGSFLAGVCVCCAAVAGMGILSVFSLRRRRNAAAV